MKKKILIGFCAVIFSVVSVPANSVLGSNFSGVW